MSVDIYHPYMRSGLWYRRRKALIDRIGDGCELCGGKGQDLHHVSYVHLMNERPSDVVHVCRPCHTSIKTDEGIAWTAQVIATAHGQMDAEFLSEYRDTRPKRKRRKRGTARRARRTD